MRAELFANFARFSVADPFNLRQTLGFIFHNPKRIVAEFFYNAAGQRRANAFNHAGGQIPLHGFFILRQHTAKGSNLELLAIGIMLFPVSMRYNPFSHLQIGQNSNHRHELQPVVCLYLDHLIAGIFIRKNTAHYVAFYFFFP